MIGMLVSVAREKATAFNFEKLAPRCDGEDCPGNRARWHGLLRRSDGLRFEGHWYCSSECFRTPFEFRLRLLLSGTALTSHTSRHRMPLGLTLLSRGIIRHDQLQSALQHQRDTGQLLGVSLCQLGFAEEEQIVAAVASQWGCPVYPADRSSECRHLVPRLLQEKHLMIPIHWVAATRDLYLAFARSVNHTLLYSIERMLDCHTVPCFINETELLERLRRVSSLEQDSEIAIETAASSHEICGSVVSYAQQIGAQEARLLGCDGHLWIRLIGARVPFDLLFRHN